MPTSLKFRALTTHDQVALWHWLRIALWDPPPAGLRPVEVLQRPAVRIYAESWGLPSDIGLVAQVDGKDAGACWLRLLPVGVGLASVDAETPQLGIALDPAYQHQGHGRPLMRATLKAAARAGYLQVSLTVHPRNPALHLYESCGFRMLEVRHGFHLMVARTDQPLFAELDLKRSHPALATTQGKACARGVGEMRARATAPGRRVQGCGLRVRVDGEFEPSKSGRRRDVSRAARPDGRITSCSRHSSRCVEPRSAVGSGRPAAGIRTPRLTAVKQSSTGSVAATASARRTTA